MMTREEFEAKIIRQAAKWVGVPYRHRGRSKNGVDCLGLPVCIYKAVGIDATDGAKGYGRWWMLETDEESYKDGLEEHCHEVAFPRPGDLLLFRQLRTAPANHLGMSIGDCKFVHAIGMSNVSGVFVTQMRHKYWGARIDSFWRPDFAPQVI